MISKGIDAAKVLVSPRGIYINRFSSTNRNGFYRKLSNEVTSCRPPCIFTGALHGDDLPAAYASSALFVFPSATATFGNVVLEAQASSVPIIVTDQGGPCENMRDGLNGVVIAASSISALLSAMETMISNPEQLTDMGSAARHTMESRSFEAAFNQGWEMFSLVNTHKLAMAV